MSKEEKKTKEEVSPRKAAKETLEVKKGELKTFMKENKLKEDSEPTDKKIAKEFKAKRDAVTEARKAFKETKGASGRRSTHEYPAGMTDPKEKKKFRAAARAKAKKGDKPAKEEKAEKSSKAEKPKEEAKKDKKKKSDD